jgi:hypothetical protein
MTKNMKAYFNVILNDSKGKALKKFSSFLGTVPVHFVRYEDLIVSPAETNEDLFKFLLDMNDI